MNVLVGIDTQPEFPELDLTEENAQTLELLLANKMIVQNAHALADRNEWAFRVGHPAVIMGGRAAMTFEGAQVAAVEHGVMVFEAMTTVVSGQSISNDVIGINHAALTVTGARAGNNKSRLLEIVDQFQQDMPRTTEVIVSASRRHVGGLAMYAVFGAALERYVALGQTVMDYGVQ